MINTIATFVLFFALSYGYGEEEVYGALSGVLGATAAILILIEIFPGILSRTKGGQEFLSRFHPSCSRNAAVAVVVGNMIGGWRQGWAYGLLLGGIAYAATRITTDKGSQRSVGVSGAGGSEPQMTNGSPEPLVVSEREGAMPIVSGGSAVVPTYGSSAVRASDRFIARCLDVWICSYAGMFLLGFTFPGAVQSMLGPTGEGVGANPTLMAALSILVGMAIETVGYSFAGFTPGKSLLGISVVDKSGVALNASDYAIRQFMVWLQGMALGLGLLFTISALVQFRSVRSSGETSYDRNRFEVRQITGMETRRMLGRVIFLAGWLGWAYSIS